MKLWDFEYNTRRPHQSLGGRPQCKFTWLNTAFTHSAVC
ncbi:MAG TPA: hypothetical protein HPP81_08045 [Deltaproteobacteria bacterium]|nr:hypothetical protein [Deltaproteobacteria bacterium]